MTHRVTIALDAMGGDNGMDIVLPAALEMLKKEPSLALILTGIEPDIRSRLNGRENTYKDRLSIKHASQVIEMDDQASHALRTKKDSSMRVAINLVKNGTADACVSAGNTGALMATARFVLKTIPGIDRPAICTAIPSINGHVHVLDLGANIDCTPDHLFQFAVMGAELVTAVDNIERPRVGLLNIGEEEVKGIEKVKETAEKLADSPLNYIGFVEGNDIFYDKADVVVADGFIGNVALKSSEGAAKMISHFMKEGFNKNILTRLAGLVALPVINTFKKKIDPRRYNGATFLGLRGIVVKSHGGADAFAYANAIKIAMLEVEKAVPQRISTRVEILLS